MARAPALGEGVVSRGPGDGEGQEAGSKDVKGKRTRTPRPSPSQFSPQEAFEEAHDAALRLLAGRERSQVEIRTRLRAKGYGPETIVAVLDRLGDSGLQSDERFAEAFALEAQRNRGLSSRSVQDELRRRGVDEGLAAEAATEPVEEEEARARELASRRAARLGGYPSDVRYRRILAFLGRRGYPPELCRRLAAETTGRSPDDDDGPREG